MFRIRRIYDNVIQINKLAIAQVQAIMRTQFAFLDEDEIVKLPEKLRNPLKHKFRSILFVADDLAGQVKGFALVLHEPDVNFYFLDLLSSAKQLSGRGIGGILFERVRQEVLALKSNGLFFECLPDDPKLNRDPLILKENIARLRFYERYGARPIINTAYETPLNPEDDNPPYLVFDDLGQNKKLSRDYARKVVRAILEKKYGDLCPPQYVTMVVESFRDDPVQIRKPKYIKTEPIVVHAKIPHDHKIALAINDKHEIHHVRERGYVESPIRINTILKEIEPTGLFESVPVKHFSDKYLKLVHDPKFVDYLKKVCEKIEPGKSIYPYVFPIRNTARPPKELPIRAGYYCIDTFTPLNQNAYLAARRAVDCALTAADEILRGQRIAYALIRPPGHHAERKSFGGFCYFNSNAIAAQYLSASGKVAILDIDYHHGNGQQDIFYERSDVLTISIHGHPRFAFPYFTGFEDETGSCMGEKCNVNFTLQENVTGQHYQEILKKALHIIRKFQPQFLVLAVGFDTAKKDPTGSWSLSGKDFEGNGKMIGAIRLPTLIVQEGGYNHRNLGINARHFFNGFWNGMFLN
jgi:acetoin utilization deacetylase AcuC-like enzyme/GNAT superfamily N-acetyltransferase